MSKQLNYLQILKDEFVPPLYSNNAHSMYYFLVTFKKKPTCEIFTKVVDSFNFISYYLLSDRLEIIHFHNETTTQSFVKLSQLKKKIDFDCFAPIPYNHPILFNY